MASGSLAFVTQRHTSPHHPKRSARRRPTAPSYPRGPGENPSTAAGRRNTLSTKKYSPARVDSLLLLPGSPDSAVYAAAIEACDRLRLGRQLHAHALRSGYAGSPEFLQTKLVTMYGRCGSLEGARYLFENMPSRSLYTWSGICSAYVDHGFFVEALLVFLRLLTEEIGLGFFIFPAILGACGGLELLGLGKQLHGFVVKRKFVSNIYVGNALIDMYGKCQSVDDARLVLRTMPMTDCVSWNSMVTACAASGGVFEALKILQGMQSSGSPMPNLVTWSAVVGGFVQNGCDREALDLLHQMRIYRIDPNAQTLASVLPACARLQALKSGKEIHGYIVRHHFMSNSFIINGLVDVYRRSGDMSSASKIFLRFSVRNSVSFNTMIVGYCEKGEVKMARKLFEEMELHGVERETISWNSMISGYADNGHLNKALELFRAMQFEVGVSPDSFTLSGVIAICTDRTDLRHGQEVHSFAITKGLTSDAYVNGALIEMYCRCQDLISAWKIFERISEKDVETWNSLISGYARCNQMERAQTLLSRMKTDGFEPNVYTWNGILAGYMENRHYELALQMFVKMQTANLKHDIYTMGIILPACSRLASIERGMQVHAHLIRCYWDSDVHLGTALVDMYAKCGSIKHAEQAFYRISQHNLVAYNAMLAGYATHGLGKEVTALFHRLLSDGIEPDEITFLSLLSSCAQGGLIKQGYEYFTLMQSFDIKPEIKHYTCMVDLLSRAGHLNEAYRLSKEMPTEPDAVMWGALLRGCVIHRNHELGEIVAKKLVQLEGNAGNYIVLANLYASARRHDDFTRTMRIIRGEKMNITSGCSWIEDGSRVHVFLAGDISHKRTIEIYETLARLNLHVKSRL